MAIWVLQLAVLVATSAVLLSCLFLDLWEHLWELILVYPFLDLLGLLLELILVCLWHPWEPTWGLPWEHPLACLWHLWIAI